MRTTALLCLMALVGLWPLAAPAQQGGNAKVDESGNPIGKGQDLPPQGAFRGKRLLVWRSFLTAGSKFVETSPLWSALEAKGFVIIQQCGPFQLEWLQDIDQLWIFCSDATDLLGEAGLNAVEQFVRRGKGLYVVADNAPLVAEADAIARRLFNSSVSGAYEGDQIVAVRRTRGTRVEKQRGKSGGGKVKGSSGAARLEIIEESSRYANLHALLTGVNEIYEGITISHLTHSKSLDVLLTASDGQILASVSNLPGLKVVLDCGNTRYAPELVTKTAGTIRFAENVAAWLMGENRDADEETVLELLSSLASDDAKVKLEAAGKLAKQQAKYKDIKDQLAEIWKLAECNEPAVAKAAREQVEQAFLRAPISECLGWLGQNDPELRKLIWRQVKDRIERADAKRKSGYRTSALKVLASEQAPLGSRQAAAELLGELKDRETVKTLVNLLSELPRVIRPDVGAALRAITGEDFGPREGDGGAELSVAIKQWRTWLEANEKH